MSYVNVICQCV